MIDHSDYPISLPEFDTYNTDPNIKKPFLSTLRFYLNLLRIVKYANKKTKPKAIKEDPFAFLKDFRNTPSQEIGDDGNTSESSSDESEREVEDLDPVFTAVKAWHVEMA